MKEIFKNLLMEFAGTGEAEQDGFYEKETDCTAAAPVAVVSEEAFEEASLEQQEIAEQQILHEMVSEPVVRRNGRTFRPARRIGIFSRRLIALATIAVLFVTGGPMKMVAKADDDTRQLNGVYHLTGNNTLEGGISTVDEQQRGYRVQLTGDTTIYLDSHTLNFWYIYTGDSRTSPNYAYNLTIIGPGEVIANAGQTMRAIEAKDLIVDNANVGVTAQEYPAIDLGGKLELKNGATVSARKSQDYPDSSAIRVRGDIINTEILTPAGGYWEEDYPPYGSNVKCPDGSFAMEVSLRARALPANTPPGKEADAPPAHTHNYEWVTVREATEDEDGEMVYMCRECGSVLEKIPLTGCSVFNVNVTDQILKTPAGGTVTINTDRWLCFHWSVRDALLKRPDVTVVVNFLSEGYKGVPMQITIPAGTDPVPFFDENGYAGFLRIKYILETTRQ